MDFWRYFQFVGRNLLSNYGVTKVDADLGKTDPGYVFFKGNAACFAARSKFFRAPRRYHYFGNFLHRVATSEFDGVWYCCEIGPDRWQLDPLLRLWMRKFQCWIPKQ